MDFTFTLRGDGQVPTRVVPAADQRKALNLTLDALKPSELTVPERVMAMIPPPPPGFNTDLTWIDGGGGTAFDQVTLAGGLANEVIGYLLQRERAARLVIFQARDANALGLDEVLGTNRATHMGRAGAGVVGGTRGVARVTAGHARCHARPGR